MAPSPHRSRQAASFAAAIGALLALAVLAFVSAPASGSGSSGGAAQAEEPPPPPPEQPPVVDEQCQVPQLVGLTVIEAFRALQATGCNFVPRLRTRTKGDELVTAQSPQAGSLARAGSQVQLTVAGAPSRGGGEASGLCGAPEPGVQCGPGNGRKVAGGGDKVPHNDGAGRDWPAVTGILWKVLDSGDRRKTGGSANDELLGHHGDELLNGGPGHDILWGDWDPKGNTTRQRDTLIGGAGNDWIYPSHGISKVSAGSGRDYVFAFYGKGTINCGPGIDVARVRQTGAFKLKNCEIVKHFCAHGSDGSGGCKKAGAARAARRD